jgi:hypothetical protein
MLQAERSVVRLPMKSLGFVFFNLSNLSRLNMSLWVDSVSDRNEYQESSWGVKSGR